MIHIFLLYVKLAGKSSFFIPVLFINICRKPSPKTSVIFLQNEEKKLEMPAITG